MYIHVLPPPFSGRMPKRLERKFLHPETVFQDSPQNKQTQTSRQSDKAIFQDSPRRQRRPRPPSPGHRRATRAAPSLS